MFAYLCQMKDRFLELRDKKKGKSIISEKIIKNLI